MRAQVANLLAAFPKVNSAMIMHGDGTVLGGNLPEGYHLETALLAPVIMRSVRDFNRRLRSNETSAFTLLGERPSLFLPREMFIFLFRMKGADCCPACGKGLERLQELWTRFVGRSERKILKRLVSGAG